MEIVEISNHYAFLPIWLAIALMGAAAGGIGLLAALLFYLLEPKKGLNLAILGMKGAGKTTLWNVITKGQLKQKPTASADEVKECTVEINGIKRKIKRSLDISGSPDMISKEYKNLITKNDFILFIFDANMLLKEGSEEYIENVKMRLNVINKYMNNCKEIHLIGSHVDKLSTDLNKRMEFKYKISNVLGDNFLKEIGCSIKENLLLLNLTNQKEVEAYIYKKLFKK